MALVGTNFIDAAAVLFDGIEADFQLTASNHIDAVVPDNARSGPITVVTPGGAIISTNQFKVTPDIQSFSPVLGPAGIPVNILGTTFTNVTSVTFNNAAAAFTTLSRGELVATVPAQATTGAIRVTTQAGTSVSTNAFLVTQSSDMELKMTVTPALVAPNNTLVFTIVASNLGPSVVSEVKISDPLPLGLQVLEVNSDRGLVTHTNGVVSGAVEALTNGTAMTLNISALATEIGGFTNRASVTFREVDTMPADNQAGVAFTVIADEARDLAIQAASGPLVIVSWPASAVPFILQSTTNFNSTNSWMAFPVTPVVVQGRNTITNEAQGERFFRLLRP